MFKLFLKGVALLLCFGTLVVAVNFKVDKYGFFQGGQFERDVAQALLDGKNILYDEVTFNEREIMRLYIQNMPKLDTAVIGSSRGMQITKDFAPIGDTFFNFGVSGADVRDIMNMYHYMRKNNNIPQNIILVVDPWIFHNTSQALSTRSNVEDYKEFLSTVLGFPEQYEKPDYATMLETVISPSVFQENIQYFFRDKTGEKGAVAIDVDVYNGETAVRQPDGTQIYPFSYRNRSELDAAIDACTMFVHDFFRIEGMTEIDENLRCQFEAFVHQMQKDDVNVTFIIPPYHPSAYELSLEEAKRFPAFFKVEPYLLDFARKNSIQVYGSLDAKILNCGIGDFLDGLHIKREAVYKIFPGLEGSKMYLQLEEDGEMVYPRNKSCI